MDALVKALISLLYIVQHNTQSHRLYTYSGINDAQNALFYVDALQSLVLLGIYNGLNST